MAAGTIDESQRKAARLAGATYLIAMPFVLYANFAITDRLIVTGDAAATARNILANVTLFRIGIACDLIYCAGLLVMVAALYTILEPVDRGLASVAAVWRLVYGLMWVRMTLDLFDGLRLVNAAPYLHVFEPERLQALAKLSMGEGFDQYYVGLLFWGLASTICCYLWIKSRYIPRALAAYGLFSSVLAALCSFAFIIDPDFTKLVNLWVFDTPIGIFEIALAVWLLVKGLRVTDTAAV